MPSSSRDDARVLPKRPRLLRLLTTARTLWGAALLIAPEAVLTHLPHQEIDRPTRTFARILGTRHVIQATFTTRCEAPSAILAGVAMDATHAAATAVIAHLAPARRTLALTDAAIAATLAGAGILASQESAAH